MVLIIQKLEIVLHDTNSEFMMKLVEANRIISPIVTALNLLKYCSILFPQYKESRTLCLFLKINDFINLLICISLNLTINCTNDTKKVLIM